MNLHKDNGPLMSTRDFTDADRTFAEVYFHHREKGEIAMTVASSWFGGDFMEFGSHDLNTFRDFLTAYNVCGMTRAFPDVQFYGFDIFGKLDKPAEGGTEWGISLAEYFKPYSDQGDRLQHHYGLLREHGLYTGQCHLVQGLFEDTLPSFSYDRKLGFACIDCNVASSYKTVFEFIFYKLMENSYVYMD